MLGTALTVAVCSLASFFGGVFYSNKVKQDLELAKHKLMDDAIAELKKARGELAQVAQSLHLVPKV